MKEIQALTVVLRGWADCSPLVLSNDSTLSQLILKLLNWVAEFKFRNSFGDIIETLDRLVVLLCGNLFTPLWFQRK
jgi:hypothetical protein